MAEDLPSEPIMTRTRMVTINADLGNNITAKCDIHVVIFDRSTDTVEAIQDNYQHKDTHTRQPLTPDPLAPNP